MIFGQQFPPFSFLGMFLIFKNLLPSLLLCSTKLVKVRKRLFLHIYDGDKILNV